jgi:AraC-like DNA-binding protein
MDPVSVLLDGQRARDPFVLSCTMSPPWSVQVADRAAVALVVVLAGDVAIVPAAGPSELLGPGHAAILSRAEPYRIADQPGTAAAVVIEPGQICRPLTAAGRRWPEPHGRSWGNDPAGETRFVVAVYELPGQVSGRLLADLPQLMTVATGANRPAVELLAAEAGRAGPGHELVLDRLADLVLIDTLRAWLAGAGDEAPAWHRADPVTAAALRLIHDRPEQPWTLALLAADAGVSRATLARRFAVDVGTPPLAYLTQWRLARAADLLCTTRRTVDSVAGAVGYTNAFAFSTAFKRQYGAAPRDYRSARDQSAKRISPWV